MEVKLDHKLRNVMLSHTQKKQNWYCVQDTGGDGTILLRADKVSTGVSCPCVAWAL